MPFLCLAFLGTRNVGQRINNSIFACSDFLGIRAGLRLLHSSSLFACQSFWLPNRHSRGQRRSDGARKGGAWLEVTLWRVNGNSRVTVPGGAWWGHARSHLLSRAASFPLHFFFSSFLFLFGPHFAPNPFFGSYLAIWDSIDDSSSPMCHTSKHLPILTILFSFEWLECAALVILLFMSFCSFLVI